MKRMPIVHVPKTIDNDYMGIDFTFGYFTAVETLGTEIRNLHADAEAARAYFVVESMGRSAGWLAYGAAISGEANMVLSVEDMTGEYLTPDSTPKRKVMDIDKVVGKIVRMMRYRQEKEGKEYGVVVLAEGLAEFLSDDVLKDVPRDDHGHISVANVDRSSTGLRMPLCTTSCVRRNAGQPAGRWCLPSPVRREAQWGNGVGIRTAGSAFCAFRTAG